MAVCDDYKFPSPCGEKVGINQKAFHLDPGRAFGVSVPLRGKGRDQLAQRHVGSCGPAPRFRPLAGKR